MAIESSSEPRVRRGSTSGPAVAWRQVKKEYPGHAGMRGVDLAVEHGELLAILGTSGSGKTTLLKMVNRLIDATSGEVWCGAADHRWDPIELRRSMGYVIQEAGLMPHMTVLANVGLVPRLQGSRKRARRRRRPLLGLVGLDPERFGGAVSASAQRRAAAEGRRCEGPGGRPRPDPHGRAVRRP